jgi:hypothetical protein
MYISWLLYNCVSAFSSEIDEEGKFNRTTLNQLRVPELISRFGVNNVIVFGDVERLRFKVPYTITNPRAVDKLDDSGVIQIER